MSSEDLETARILALPPFVTVDGIINIRDVGGYPTLSDAQLVTKPAFLFRSGEPTRVSAQGQEQLQALRIRKIFDLRSDGEIHKYKVPPPSIEGVLIVRVPVSQNEAYDPASLANRVKDFSVDAAQAFAKLYAGILSQGGPAFELILRHVIDNPDEPFLVHCTAGKDRTGVFCALYLSLLGVSEEDIATDYTLTEIGLRPMMPMLVARFQKEAIFKDNWETVLKMGSASPETIKATLAIVREEYGGVEGYLKAKANLTDEDLRRIRKNCLVSISQL
ncbi:hypothetical protein EWM64_g6934 [Hericium alpestre]|uniref:Tyrosine specific protein phosphatases domain-containing protein n=1 Tax=Hericium alpestre TaxID=135208 RepID=A0A4Y9ZSP4_9AGAM|nr:hypothetical protein EWM64_g6934 [Hericium alpestre]